MNPDRVTSRDIRDPDHPLTCLTCYDVLTARVMDRVEALDMILVGDTLGNVVLGYERTIPVTVDDMVHHTAAVSRGVDRAFLVADVPFLEGARSRDHGVRVAQRLMQEGGAQAVKLEGGERQRGLIEHLVNHDVPVVGHLGLTPQSVESMGGYRIQGTDRDGVRRLARELRMLEEVGVLCVVLECVTAPAARALTEAVSVPTIGIGSGEGCDGQVLVWQDMMGLTEDPPSFVRAWDDWNDRLEEGVQGFCEAVRGGEYPAEAESFEPPGDVGEDEVRAWVNEAAP